MEEPLLKALAQAGPTFALLGYVVWQLVAMLRMMVERNTAMAEQLVTSNLDLTKTLRELEQGRAEQQQAHAEQTLLIKMTLDEISKHHG